MRGKHRLGIRSPHSTPWRLGLEVLKYEAVTTLDALEEQIATAVCLRSNRTLVRVLPISSENSSRDNFLPITSLSSTWHVSRLGPSMNTGVQHVLFHLRGSQHSVDMFLTSSWCRSQSLEGFAQPSETQRPSSNFRGSQCARRRSTDWLTYWNNGIQHRVHLRHRPRPSRRRWCKRWMH